MVCNNGLMIFDDFLWRRGRPASLPSVGGLMISDGGLMFFDGGLMISGVGEAPADHPSKLESNLMAV